jgi:beta-lactamase regulating signal transducer with metallopeptidase domain
MMWPQLQSVSQIIVGRVLNSLPEGVFIALFAAAMLRLLPRQNSGTRFAVWFVALLAVAALSVAGLPLIGRVNSVNSLLPTGSTRPLITVPGPWGLVLFLAWIVAASVAILRLVSGLWRLRTLRRSCVAIDGADLKPAIKEMIAEFSSSRSVRLSTSERVNVPAAIGFFKPMIVIPAWALRELTPAELNIVLLHEFAHLRRGDAWTNLLQKIVRSVFLFHPAVCWIESRLSLEREMACDDQVLAETANPRGYAKCLVALLEKSVARRGWAMAQAAVHRAGEASRRIAQILDVTRPNGNHVWKPALALVGTFSLLCLVVVPHVPRFVAFDSSTRPFQNENVHTAPPNHSEMAAAAVIPAAVRTRSSSPVKKMPERTSAQTVRHVLEPRRSTPQVIAGRLSGNSEPSLVETVNAGTKQSAVPASETLLIIRTTQQVGPNSWVWSVGVWRVNLVNAVPNRPEPAPIAKKT